MSIFRLKMELASPFRPYFRRRVIRYPAGHVLIRGDSLGSPIRLAAGLRLVSFRKAADLMHAFMQHGDDAEPSVALCLPVDEVPPVAKDVAVHPKLRRYRARRDRAGRDALEGFEQSRDAGIRLGFPQRSRLYR